VERDGLKIGERLGIMTVENLGDGQVMWSWHFGDEKPPNPAPLGAGLRAGGV
jgi:hypothetical protein